MDHVREGGDWLGPLLTGICGFNAWVLWQVLRGPALPRAEGLPRDVVWLRRLLYAGVAGDLVLWELVEELSDTVEDVASLVVWAATMILLVRVVSGVSAWFRAIALALGLIGALTPVPLLFLDGPDFQAISFLGLASFGWTVMILVGQRRDGRWSDATINIGRIALVAPLASPLLGLAFQSERLPFDGPRLVVNALGVLTTLWLVRTAHELAGPADMPAAETATRPPPPAAGRGCPPSPRSCCRSLWSAPRKTPGSVSPARTRAAATRSAPTPTPGRRTGNRRSSASPGTAPTRGRRCSRRTCRTGASWRTARNCARCPASRSGGRCSGGRGDRLTWPSSATPWSSCAPASSPGSGADEAREQAEQEREREREQVAWEAEMNARCADPWPKLRARRQGTAAYLLFEGGGYAVFDDRDDTEGAGGDSFKAIDDGFIDAAGSSAAITTYGENAPMCVTVKAFGAAPPLRLKGWEQVVEVGIVSRSGRLIVPSYPEGGEAGRSGRCPTWPSTAPAATGCASTPARSSGTRTTSTRPSRST